MLAISPAAASPMNASTPMSDTQSREWEFGSALRAIDTVHAKHSAPQPTESTASSPPSLTKSISAESSRSPTTPMRYTLGDFKKIFDHLGIGHYYTSSELLTENVRRYEVKHAVKELPKPSGPAPKEDDTISKHAPKEDHKTSRSSPKKARKTGKPASKKDEKTNKSASESQLRPVRSSVKATEQVRTQSQDCIKEAKTVTWNDQSLDSVSAQQNSSPDGQSGDSSRTLSKKARHKQHHRVVKLATERRPDEREREKQLADSNNVDITTSGTAVDLNMTLTIRTPRLHSVSDGDTDADIKKNAQQSQARRNVIQEIVTPTKKPAAKPAQPVTKTNGSTFVNPHDLFVHKVSERYTSEPPRSHTEIHHPGNFQPRTDAAVSLSCANLKKVLERKQDLLEAFERKLDLLKLLFKNFPFENISLVMSSLSAKPEQGPSLSPSGIHVFVDMSNILIGFHDAIKSNRGLSRESRIPRQKLAFFNLSLILERGRAVAKRCLAGSKIVESVEEAATLGYEVSTLDLVLKAKKMTPRKQFFAERDRQARAAERSEASSGGEGHLSGRTSGIEDVYEPVKLQEQGVDEILHLKMMESVVDSEPSVMVLATGDAAEAEYSQGFLRMCERALTKGWQIELVSFKRNMSSEYRRRNWIERWNGAFRVIELDEYAEMLLL